MRPHLLRAQGKTKILIYTTQFSALFTAILGFDLGVPSESFDGKFSMTRTFGTAISCNWRECCFGWSHRSSEKPPLPPSRLPRPCNYSSGDCRTIVRGAQRYYQAPAARVLQYDGLRGSPWMTWCWHAFGSGLFSARWRPAGAVLAGTSSQAASDSCDLLRMDWFHQA